MALLFRMNILHFKVFTLQGPFSFGWTKLGSFGMHSFFQFSGIFSLSKITTLLNGQNCEQPGIVSGCIHSLVVEFLRKIYRSMLIINYASTIILMQQTSIPYSCVTSYFESSINMAVAKSGI